MDAISNTESLEDSTHTSSQDETHTTDLQPESEVVSNPQVSTSQSVGGLSASDAVTTPISASSSQPVPHSDQNSVPYEKRYIDEDGQVPPPPPLPADVPSLTQLENYQSDTTRELPEAEPVHVLSNDENQQTISSVSKQDNSPRTSIMDSERVQTQIVSEGNSRAPADNSESNKNENADDKTDLNEIYRIETLDTENADSASHREVGNPDNHSEQSNLSILPSNTLPGDKEKLSGTVPNEASVSSLTASSDCNMKLLDSVAISIATPSAVNDLKRTNRTSWPAQSTQHEPAIGSRHSVHERGSATMSKKSDCRGKWATTKATLTKTNSLSANGSAPTDSKEFLSPESNMPKDIRRDSLSPAAPLCNENNNSKSGENEADKLRKANDASPNISVTDPSSTSSIYDTFICDGGADEKPYTDLSSIIFELQHIAKESAELISGDTKDSAQYITTIDRSANKGKLNGADNYGADVAEVTDFSTVGEHEKDAAIQSELDQHNQQQSKTSPPFSEIDKKPRIARLGKVMSVDHTAPSDAIEKLPNSQSDFTISPKKLTEVARKRHEWIAGVKSGQIEICPSPDMSHPGGARPKTILNIGKEEHLNGLNNGDKNNEAFASSNPGESKTLPKSLHHNMAFSPDLPIIDDFVQRPLKGASSLDEYLYDSACAATPHDKNPEGALAHNVDERVVPSQVLARNREAKLSKSDGDDKAKKPWSLALAAVKQPCVAEVHTCVSESSTAASAAEGSDDTNSSMDLEQLLGRLNLPHKMKLQIRQASQVSLQRQIRKPNERFWHKKRKWKSMDEQRLHTSTPPSTPSTPRDKRSGARAWNKLPMAIKLMSSLSNLRKKQPSIEEDRLSLEFYVPGKNTYIRLHRRTFFNFLLKYALFFFTFIFWIGSLSGLGFGAWMLTRSSVIIDDVTDIFLDPYVLLLGIGATIFIVAFIGCLGALRENICLLKIFQVSLSVVLVIELLLSTLVFLFYTMPEFRSAVKVGPEEFLKSAVKQYFDDEVMQKWMDTVQKEFGCCGVSMSDEGYLDWQENQYFNCSKSNPSAYRCSVPLSCCIFEPGDYINYMCGANIMDPEHEFPYVRTMINTKGCMKSFGEWLAEHDAIIFFLGLGLFVLQILGVVSARYFVKNLREGQQSRQQSDRVQIGPAEEEKGVPEQ